MGSPAALCIKVISMVRVETRKTPRQEALETNMGEAGSR